ncbi:MAG: hypothetical protein ABUL77_02575 [Bacteroidota bacterium]
MNRVAPRPIGTAAASLGCAVALAAAVLIFRPTPARAAEPASVADSDGDARTDARAVVGPLAGVATALIPLAVGGALLADDDRPDRQRAGTYVILAGFAAAPWVSHAITGRWRRAFGFGLASLATSLGALGAMRVQDPYDPNIANHGRLAFGFLLTSAFFATTVGLVDSFIEGPVMSGER